MEELFNSMLILNPPRLSDEILQENEFHSEFALGVLVGQVAKGNPLALLDRLVRVTESDVGSGLQAICATRFFMHFGDYVVYLQTLEKKKASAEKLKFAELFDRACALFAGLQLGREIGEIARKRVNEAIRSLLVSWKNDLLVLKFLRGIYRVKAILEDQSMLCSVLSELAVEVLSDIEGSQGFEELSAILQKIYLAIDRDSPPTEDPINNITFNLLCYIFSNKEKINLTTFSTLENTIICYSLNFTSLQKSKVISIYSAYCEHAHCEPSYLVTQILSNTFTDTVNSEIAAITQNYTENCYNQVQLLFQKHYNSAKPEPFLSILLARTNPRHTTDNEFSIAVVSAAREHRVLDIHLKKLSANIEPLPSSAWDETATESSWSAPPAVTLSSPHLDLTVAPFTATPRTIEEFEAEVLSTLNQVVLTAELKDSLQTVSKEVEECIKAAYPDSEMVTIGSIKISV